MESVFAVNPDVNELLVFEDGNCFKLKDRNLADHHKAMTGQDYKLVVRGQDKKEEPKQEESQEEKQVKTKTKNKNGNN